MHADKTTLLDGDASAVQLFSGYRKRTAALVEKGYVPKLVSILVGDDPASAMYIGRKHETCARLGIASEEIRLPADVTQADLLSLLTTQNADPLVDGILVQLPLPPHLDDIGIGMHIDPAKDVDGLHPVNLGKLLMAAPDILPCTPAGVLHLLQTHDIPLAGQHVCIIGRGMLVGRPLAMLLSLKGIDARITLLHRGSGPLDLKDADIVISAVGQPDFIAASMIKPGAVVVGVGISYTNNGQMVSDIAPDVAAKASAVTPPHGSVGALTRAKLIENLLLIATRRADDPGTRN